MSALSGPVASWLGRISFPLYVIHLPVIGSLGWAVFNNAPVAAAPWLAIAVSVACSLLVAMPLASLDRAWTRQLADRVRPDMLPPRIAAWVQASSRDPAGAASLT